MATQTAAAVFVASATPQAVTWPAMVGVFGTNWGINAGIVVTDGNGPVGFELTSVTTTGATVTPSDSFSGTITIETFDMP